MAPTVYIQNRNNALIAMWLFIIIYYWATGALKVTSQGGLLPWPSLWTWVRTSWPRRPWRPGCRGPSSGCVPSPGRSPWEREEACPGVTTGPGGEGIVHLNLLVGKLPSMVVNYPSLCLCSFALFPPNHCTLKYNIRKYRKSMGKKRCVSLHRTKS